MATRIALRKRNGILEFLGVVGRDGKIKKVKTKAIRNPDWAWKYKRGRKNVERLKGHPGYAIMHDIGFSGKNYRVGTLDSSGMYFTGQGPTFYSRKDLNKWVRENLSK